MTIKSFVKKRFDLLSGSYFCNDDDLHRIFRMYKHFNDVFFFVIAQNNELLFEEQRSTDLLAVFFLNLW